ncbi:LuxR family two component transcriptional regulator [Algoriphagus aquaeductus]|jgi:DNA-binding NarL/FixJ family response regulator|uniref:LuxR family two component transcriptional regulator n=1 Tax=Algoriphagus aquaeductus TaxID=475299 RepID=A0A326RQD4_9BACT|nr:MULTISPECIES: response regulator transcription factor [Algoriphagus]PZV79646.1 LuxR family two component transcriptional regulator [Algoriphagus aquaeductus]
MQPIQVVLADDHVVVRNGIKMLLENEKEITVIGEASDGIEALEEVKEKQPDLLIIDIRMPHMNGLEATSKLKNYSSKTRSLILSMHQDEDYILQAVENGADGYLLKDSSREEFLKAIRTVSQGGKYFSGDVSNILVNSLLNKKNPASKAATTEEEHPYDLTKREKQILQLVYEGTGNKEIADSLGKSIRTIETHRFNIMKKLKVNNVVELLKKVDDEPNLKRSLTS